ncbi:MAG: hypothetical protein AVDCRST_MAG64-1705 [uncultured Phycisphaerae bacterium]|uniref:Pyrrolo-quinoline quinone repeat domain-containing protein n=1 Tax=uncultured Phycisphaerae bacterium TaxID=904963 RepID=A0A6J4P0J7_9BACT|nr:MAG: hypothetical protein AVDCRST_MAG64-1705 [uncultured Phycisphaerae bacterium]
MKPTWRTTLTGIACGVGLTAASWGVAADWAQWRGPTRDGVSAETGLLSEWPKTGPRLAWQAKDVGFGYSTPSVVGGRLYLLSNEGLDNEFARCLSAADGKTLWTTRLGKVGNPNQKPRYPGAKSTPAVDGDVLYALGSDGDLACLEAATGAARWRKSLRADFGGAPGEWGYSDSPLVDGDVLVVTPGGARATVVALDKKTGDVVWQSAVPGGDAAAYASVVAADIGGVKQYVQFLAKGLVGLDAKTGKLLWRYDKTGAGPANMTTPLVHDGIIYTGGGLNGGGAAKVTGDAAGGFRVEQLYFEKKLPTTSGGVVRVGDHLYGTIGNTLACFDFKTGKILWQDRSVGPASFCLADRRLYALGEDGEVALIEPSGEKYVERGRFALPDRPARQNEKAWAHPVIADGRLYVRDLGSVWCYDVRAAAQAAR